MRYKNPKENPYPCYLCGEPHQNDIEKNSYNICEVCGWEDDGFQFDHPDETGANGTWTYREAKAAWEAGETLFPNHPNPKAPKTE